MSFMYVAKLLAVKTQAQGLCELQGIAPVRTSNAWLCVTRRGRRLKGVEKGPPRFT
jgi:hypothetical protein